MTNLTYLGMYIGIGFVLTAGIASKRNFATALHPVEGLFVMFLWPVVSIVIIGCLIKDGLGGLFKWLRKFKGGTG